MKHSLILALLIGCSAWSVTIEDINDKPMSRAKNFLIWQFMKQDINASEAQNAFYQIDTVNERFLLDYAQKTDEAEIRYTADCLKKISTELMSIEQDDCLYLALTPAKAQLLSSEEREKIASRLDNQFGSVQWLRTMNQANHFLPGSDGSAVEDDLQLFLMSSPAYRQEHFNHPIDSQTLTQITAMKGFSRLVYLSATDPKMDQLQASLAEVSGGSYDYQTHFYLAINALKFARQDNALFHLKEAKYKAYSRMDADKSLFWLYRITQEQEYLNQLAQSVDINMYTLWAKERQGIETENYFTTLPTTRSGGFKGDDPFKWQSLHKEIVATRAETLVDLIEQYDGEDSVALQAYMLERTYTPLIHNFTMAYDQYMTGLSNDQKAVMYSLMRQETRFIPGLISRSFALGLMQLMPFVVDEIAQTHPFKPTSYDDMFQPEHNIDYAFTHLQYLDKYLYHPLFVAYAYNGGLGFTKRMLMNGTPFMPGEYEPFMSMELIGNDESREYGKKVLANYVIYKKILGEKVAISELLDSLTQPNRTDYFRAEALKKTLQ